MSLCGSLFTKYGSDKNTNHRYGPVYDQLFPNRAAVKNVLEVGLAQGQSILAWREIFISAHIVGIDIEPCSVERGPRLEIHQGDQRDEHALLRAVNGRKFDLIVEDASHIFDNSLRTLFFLWPHVAPGGLYVIEELQDVNGHLDNLSLFKNCQSIATKSPFDNQQDEILVVLRK